MKSKESEKIELKTSFSEWKEAIVALCAFANKKGGKVIIGMDDDGDSAGIQIGKGTIEDFVNKIKNHTDPVLYPSVNIKTFGLGEILEALREAVINALVHRDYSDPGNIQIRIFDSSLEIWSPGFLPKEINIKNILVENRSVPRNKKLVEVFHKIGLMESWGTGFQRIVEECEKNGNKIPEFSEKAGAFVVSFRKREGKADPKDLEKLGEKLGENQIKIIDFIQANKNITIPELAKKLGISSTAVENNIAKIKEKGLLERVGPDKGGYWEIIKKF